MRIIGLPGGFCFVLLLELATFDIGRTSGFVRAVHSREIGCVASGHASEIGVDGRASEIGSGHGVPYAGRLVHGIHQE